MQKKTFTRTEHSFTIKTLNKSNTELGMYFSIIKALYDKLIPNIILSDEKLKAFSSKIRSNTRMPTLAASIQHSTGSPSLSNQTRKRTKASKLVRKK